MVRCDLAILVLMHCHVDLDVALACVDAKHGVLAVVTCPCCQWIGRHASCFGRGPDAAYLDYGILSEKREVRVWVNALGADHQVHVPNIAELPECTELSLEDLEQNMKWSSSGGDGMGGKKQKEETRDSKGIARVRALRETIEHLESPSTFALTLPQAQEYIMARMTSESTVEEECPSHCVLGMDKRMPLLDKETKGERNARQVCHVAASYYSSVGPNKDPNVVHFHGMVVRKRTCVSISFFTIMPVGSTEADGKRAQKAWSKAVKQQKQKPATDGSGDGKATGVSVSSSSSSTSSSLSSSSSTSTSSLQSISIKQKYTYNAVQISIVNGYVPTTALPQANQTNPAVAWQKCIKVGDHVEMTGTIGRSSTGQPTVFVFDLSIVGQIGRTAV